MTFSVSTLSLRRLLSAFGHEQVQLLHVSEQSTECLELARGSGSGTLEENGKFGKLAFQGTQDGDLRADRTSLPGVHHSSASGELRHASAYSVRRTSSCRGTHFSRFYSVCSASSFGGVSACGVCCSSSCGTCFSRSCRVRRTNSCGETHRCRDSDKPRCASACSVCRTCSCGGINFFRFCSVYCTYFHHGVHRTSGSWVSRGLHLMKRSISSR